MTVGKDDFIEICEEFPSFHAFLTQRALTRRNYFKLLDLKRHKTNVKELLKAQTFERMDINDDSDVEDNDDFLFNPELMVLDDNEKPETLMENIHLSIRFTISMFRMYLSQVGDMAGSMNRRLLKHH